jgi:hypothetical protein
MMLSMSPDDLPRIRISRQEHPSVKNFYREYVQVFLGHAIPPSQDSDWPPIEEFTVGGWKLGFTADEVRSNG